VARATSRESSEIGTVGSAWFSTQPESAVCDFFDVCAQRPEALEAGVRALERAGGALATGELDQQVADTREWLGRARGGDWQPFEHHLRSLGSRYARAGLPLSAWYGIASSFSNVIVSHAVAAYAAAPARLTAVLLVLSEFVERSLSIITDQKRAAEALAHSGMRLEVLSTTAHEFASSSGNIGMLLELVARRLGEILGDGCAVRLISQDGAWLEPSASFYHHDPENRELARQVLGTERQRIGEGLAGRAAANGEPVLVPVLDAEAVHALVPAAFRPMLARVGISSALAIPLRSHGRTIGAVSLLRSRPGNPYTIDDQHLAQDLADRAGLAIDNAVLVATLEQRVAERTQALETVNRELEAFSYSVSHDLRTPLRAIDGFSRALLADYEAKLDDRGQRYLHRIRAGTQRMASLIDDLLNLARITRVSLKLAALDVSALAEEVVAELHKREPGRTIAIHIAPGVSARADVHLVKIALENLLGNSWKFTAKRAQAEIWFGADAGTFFVRDNGAGFDMAHAEKLFAPFHRLHAINEYDGTGVGLAIVHRIVSHHGGRIWAEAEVGKGATFYFTLGDIHGTADHPARRG
jgi:signal transduction histidine kinase